MTECVFGVLPPELQDQFTFDETAECYVAAGLTAERLERAAKAALYTGAGPVFLRSDTRGVHISAENGPDARRINPSRSWAE